MKSNVCKLEKGSKDLEAIFKESEKVAVYNGLDQKQTLHLRLLCEEIDGMLPNIVGDFDGELWITFENGVCKVNISLKLAEITADEKESLINIATNKKNAAAKGIVGKIRSGIEDFFLTQEALQPYITTPSPYGLATGYSEGLDYTYLWSLAQYRDTVRQESSADAWDELEKSVIASVADDVMVGIVGRRVDIVIVKAFE